MNGEIDADSEPSEGEEEEVTEERLFVATHEKCCVSAGEMEKIFRAKCEDFEIQFSQKLFERFLNHQMKKEFNKTFEMSSCALGQNAALVLANMIYNKKQLRIIDISGNRIGDTGALCFADLIVASRLLIAVNLASNSIADRGGEAIFKAMCRNKTIVSLNVGSTSVVGRNSFGPATCSAMSLMLAQNGVLNELDISMSEITADTIPIVSEGLSYNRSLRVINLANNNIQSRGTVIFIQACMKTSLEELYMGNNHLKDDVSGVFASFLKSSAKIRVLDLTGNYLTKRFTAAIAPKIREMSDLMSLNLSNNPLQGDGLAELSGAFVRNTRLKHFYADNCEIDTYGFGALCDVLMYNEGLISLHVARNPIRDQGAKRLADVVLNNEVIKELDLELCDITEAGGDELFAAIAQSKSVTKISVKNNLIRNGPMIQKAVIGNPRIFSVNLDYNTLDYKVIFVIQTLVAENKRKWKRGQKNRVQEEVDRLGEVNEKLVCARKEIVDARLAVQRNLSERHQLREERDLVSERKAERLTTLQSQFSVISEEARTYRDKTQDEKHDMLNRVSTSHDESENMINQLNHSLEMLRRDGKALQGLEQRIIDARQANSYSMESTRFQYVSERARYKDACKLVHRRWKEARLARGLPITSRKQTKAKGGRKSRRGGDNGMSSDRMDSTDAEVITSRSMTDTDTVSERSDRTTDRDEVNALSQTTMVVRTPKKRTKSPKKVVQESGESGRSERESERSEFEDVAQGEGARRRSQSVAAKTWTGNAKLPKGRKSRGKSPKIVKPVVKKKPVVPTIPVTKPTLATQQLALPGLE